MKTSVNVHSAVAVLVTTVVWLAGPAVGQQANSGPAVHMIVTAEARKGKQVPPIAREDVLVRQGNERRPVTGWTPFQGINAALQLYVLIDDALGADFGTQLQDVQSFITSQLPATSVGVAFMRDGTVEIVQKPTTDHAAASKNVRIPQAISTGSPYESLMELIKRWPAGAPRCEIMMISPGFEAFGVSEANNPIVVDAITAAQRAGIPVFTAYFPAAGHWGHSWWRISWGLTYLSRIADETGGEAYGSSGVVPVSVTPYLNDLTQRLQHQYELTFVAKPQPSAGMQQVSVRTETSDVDLLAPDRVFVPASK
jgi:hypothetical protein